MPGWPGVAAAGEKAAPVLLPKAPTPLVSVPLHRAIWAGEALEIEPYVWFKGGGLPPEDKLEPPEPWYRQCLAGRMLHVIRRPPALTFELERLIRIAGRLDVPQWLVERAAYEISCARQCSISEGYDRIAHALEALARRTA